MGRNYLINKERMNNKNEIKSEFRLKILDFKYLFNYFTPLITIL